MANVGSLLVEIGADVARLRRDMGKAAQVTQNQARVMSRHLSGIGNAAGKVSLAINAIGVAGAGLGVGMMVKQFADLDAGLVGVKKTTGMTGAELAGLGADIQKITTELPLTSQELLAIAQSAGQLGVKGRADILAFTKTVGMLGTASDLSGEEAATSLARILNITNESASSVNVLGSVIVALGNDIAASESEIARMTTEVAQATSTFEISSAEAAALGATLKSLGVRAELGGSSVGRAFRAIDAAVRSGGDSLKDLETITGMTGEQLRRTFAENSVAVFQAFITGLGRMIGEGKSAASVLEQFGLKGEEVLKSLPTLAKRSDELARALALANKETKNARALTEEALAASKSFSAQMRITGNVLDVIASDIGRELAPAILDVAQDFREWTNVNRDFIKQDVGGSIRGISDSVASLASQLSDSTSLSAVSGGLIGSLLFGPKGGAVIGGTIHTVEAFMQSYSGFRAAMSGDISWSDYATSNYAELKKMLTDVQQSAIDPRNRDFIGRIHAGAIAGGDPIASPKKTKTTIVPDSALPSKTYSHDFDAQIKDWQRFQDDKMRTIEQFDRDYKRITLGETAFQIAEVQARSEQLQTLVQGDSEKIAQIKQWEALKIKDLNESAAEASRTAWERYADSAMDHLQNTADVASNVARSTEDALVDAAMGGANAFSNMAQSIASDLLRMGIRESITGPLFSGLSAAFGFHDGGMVGGRPTFTRSVDPSVFTGAPRYHSGGVAGLAPNEVPAILERGEIVIPKGQASTSGSAPNLDLTIINETGQQLQTSQSDISFDGERWVMTTWLRGMRNNTANARDMLQRGL